MTKKSAKASRPKAQKPARGRKAPRRMKVAKVGKSVYDPTNPKPPPVVSSVAPAALDTGTTTITLMPVVQSVVNVDGAYDNAPGLPTVLFVAQTQCNAVACLFSPQFLVTKEDNGSFSRTFTPKLQLFTTNFFAEGQVMEGTQHVRSTLGPTASKAGRLGTSIVARTRQIDREGVVYQYMPDQRLGTNFEAWFTQKYTPSGSSVLECIMEWIDSPGTKTYSAEYLADHGLKSFSHPVDQAAYETFSEWYGTDSSQTSTASAKQLFFDSFCIGEKETNLAPRALCPMIYVFSATQRQQSYEVRITSQWWHRYPAGNVMVQMHRPLPTSSIAHVNKERRELEKHNSDHAALEPFVSGAKQFGGSIMSGVSGAAGNLAGVATQLAGQMLLQRMLSRAGPPPLMIE